MKKTNLLKCILMISVLAASGSGCMATASGQIVKATPTPTPGLNTPGNTNTPSTPPGTNNPSGPPATNNPSTPPSTTTGSPTIPSVLGTGTTIPYHNLSGSVVWSTEKDDGARKTITTITAKGRWRAGKIRGVCAVGDTPLSDKTLTLRGMTGTVTWEEDFNWYVNPGLSEDDARATLQRSTYTITRQVDLTENQNDKAETLDEPHGRVSMGCINIDPENKLFQISQVWLNTNNNHVPYKEAHQTEFNFLKEPITYNTSDFFAGGSWAFAKGAYIPNHVEVEGEYTDPNSTTDPGNINIMKIKWDLAFYY